MRRWEDSPLGRRSLRIVAPDGLRRRFVLKGQREADVVVEARPPHPPTPSAIRRRDSHSTSARRLTWRGKPKVHGQVQPSASHNIALALPRLCTTYDPRRTSNKLSVARTVGVLYSRFICGL